MKGMLAGIIWLFLFFPVSSNAQITTSSQWTWMKGSTAPSAPAVYGTQGVAAAANTPGTRYGSVTWTDAAGNLWLFGGRIFITGGDAMLNDLWKYNPATNQWTWVNGDSTGNQPGIYGTLGTAAATNKPGARYFGVAWTDAAGNLWLFGGSGAYSVNMQFNDLWKYNPNTNQWTWINGANTTNQQGVYGTIGVAAAANRPGARYGSVAWTDATGNLWLFGSDGYNDLWKYNPATNQWTWMNGSNTSNQAGVYGTLGTPASSNTPGVRLYSFTWTDAAGKLWLFGGFQPSGNSFNDLWKYDPATNQWTWINGANTVNQQGVYGTLGTAATGNKPGARSAGVKWTDATGKLWLWGGYGYAAGSTPGWVNDLWKYDPATNQWTWINGANTTNQASVFGTQGTPAATNRPSARAYSVSWTGGTGDFWLFSGNAGASSDDLWKLGNSGSSTLPNLTVNDVSHSEGNSGTTTYTFTVSLSAPAPTGGVTFDITTANGTATAGSDYVARSLTGQTIAAGSSTYTFDVQVNGDVIVEPDETFFVNVTNAANATITDGQGLGTIVNDDCDPITINPAALPNATQGTPYSQTIVISGGNNSYSTALTGNSPPGLSLSGNILSGTPTTTGSYSFTVTATATNSCTNPVGKTYTITVSPVAPPSLTINDVSHSEGNNGITTYSFTVSLSIPAPAGGVTFDIATANSTATAGSDYVAKSLTGQTIAAGSSTYIFDVLVNGDNTVEPDEAFFVNVSNVTGATIADGQAIGTIVNDDFTNDPNPTSSQWTWMKGDNIANAPGVYGTQGVAAAANKPGARNGSVSWTDAAGNFWLFGGQSLSGQGQFNDLWKYNPATNQWAWMKGDAASDQLGVYGTMGTAAATNKPGSRTLGATWIDASGNFWLFGGFGRDGIGSGGQLSDLWKYSPATNQWTWVKGPNTAFQQGVYGTIGTAAVGNMPGARYSSASWKDAAGNFWLFGGNGYAASGNGFLNDLWKYDPAANQWTWMKGASTISQPGIYGVQGTGAAANTPGARYGSASWTDASGNFWLFGGYIFNDLWKYTPTTNQWTWVKGANTATSDGVYGTLGIADPANIPLGRLWSFTWMDAAGDFWLFGGYSYARLNDLWKYNPPTNQWTWVKGSNTANQQGLYGTMGTAAAANKPGARESGSSWIDATGNFWLFGGDGYPASSSGLLNDLWKLGNPTVLVPPNLTINDVSHNEGNSGTTTYTFTVSLSAPAPAGGVSFNIATADGTATAGSDYVARSLTAQTIPAGSTTYTFDVQVAGDLQFEPDETFSVNVSNVTGAAVTDGQATGTIINDDAAPIAQTISFTALPAKTFGDPPFKVTATASSGLPVTFRIVSGPATIQGDTITLTGAGTVVIEANQAGNPAYNPAPPVQQSFTVLQPKAPDLAVQQVEAVQTMMAPDDTVALSWKVTNVGSASSAVNWTERIYMQSTDGQNRTLLKQVDFTNSNVLDTSQAIARNTVVILPHQFNIGDQGVFAVELLPGATVHEAAGTAANNTGIQQTPWAVRKALSLQLSAAQLTEGGEELTVVVNRTGSLANALTATVNLTYPGRFSFPASVTIPAGQGGVSFAIAAPDNTTIDGTVKDTLRVSAAGFQTAAAALSLLDNDKPSLTITNLPAQAVEGNTVTFKVATNLAPAGPLQVFLTSGNQERFPVPAVVTIPAGSLSVDVTVNLQQDNIPEIDLGVNIMAGAAAHNPANATIQVKDDDLPNLELILQSNTVSEGGGPFATQATLRRTASSNTIGFTAHLSASLPNTLILPGAVSLAAGQNEKTFTVGVVDNGQVDGQRQVIINASVFVPSCSCSAPPASAGSVSATLTVDDNDGPSLKLTATPLTLPEGAANAGLLRITRNTSTASSLLVNLSSSDATEATVPPTVLIPAGQSYTDVPITTVNDGISDGNQQVYFYATTSGFSTGSVWVIVTDLNKPDLQISSVSLPSDSIQATEPFHYQVSIKNTGFANAPAGVLVRGYLSKDDVIDASDTLISEEVIAEPIGAGQTVGLLNAARSPNLPGRHKLIFWVNPKESLSELLVTNNTSQPVALTLRPGYTATANVGPLYFSKGTPISVTGSAVRISGAPAANEPVEVYVITAGLRRKILATTDGTGNYTTQFIPLAKEAGHYTVGASFPGMDETTEQDAFDILGVRINGGDIPQFRITLNDTLRGSLTVQNLSNKSLANFSLAPVTLINGARFRFDTLSLLAGNATAALSYSITGSALSSGNNFEIATLQARANEGTVQTTDVYYFCQAPNAYVVADIATIHVTASQSAGERLVEFRLVNKGRGSTGTVTVQLPQVAWLKSATPLTMPSMAPGDTALVILKFLALPEVPFDYPITGTIVINTQNGNSFPIPFSFEKVSQTTGTVKITATDQFTYFSDGAPKVKGALVRIKNYFSGVVYAEGYTDSAGVFTASGIPEGRHRVTVDKDKHLSYDGTITIDPGDTVSATAFLNYQAITFSWNVVPTAVQDQYDITLTAQFETHIPIPVVTIEMPDTMPQLFGSDVYAFNVTLTNHGLITANNVALTLPADNPKYEFVMNYEPADLLAQQSIQVPVLMRRRTSPVTGVAGRASVTAVSQFLGMQTAQYSAAAAAGSSSSNCRDFAGVIYSYKCNIYTGLWQENGVFFTYSGEVCGGKPLPIVVNIPPNYPTFPCAICPTIVLPPPGVDPPPPVGNKKKGCVLCIAKITESLAECAPVGHGLKALVCVIATTMEHPGWAYIKCIPHLIPDPIKCTFTIIETLHACLDTSGGGASSGRTDAVTGQAQNSATPPPLGAAFQEIATNLQTVADAYRVSDRWAREYFGTMAESSAWDQLEPMLEPFVTNVDSIGHSAQTRILSDMAGYDIQPSAIQAFFTRWNRSIQARNAGVLQPNTQYPDIINWMQVQAWSDSIVAANNLAISKGFSSADDMYKQAYVSLNEIIDGQSNAVCASVTVQFSQQLTMTREAFEGTLDIFNGHPTDKMDSLSVNIQITDEAGVPSNGHFEIQTKSLTNLSDVTGTGAIGAQQRGSVKYLFIPELTAAPQAPKEYNFGGSVRYWDPYARAMVTLPLSPVPLTVNPGPNLMLHYFMERNILGDDALTSPDIEPSVPAELAVMVENQGYGPAVNMTISSAQPKVVDNEKGLAIQFNLIGSNFQGQPRNLGVTNINFGTVPPLQTRIGQWYFTSSLLGKFVSYQADVVHANSFGNPELSLVKGVKLHELTKSIREYGVQDDGINDFLVNDIFDVHDRPDIIYFSQGVRTAKVYPATAGSFSSPVSPPSFTNSLTVTASAAGWNYIQLDDPGNKLYELAGVTRSDGQVIPLNNAWLTFVTLPVSRQPVYENKFHFVDSFPSLTPVTYTVVWKPKNLNVPRVDSITGFPQQVTSTQVQHLRVVFNKKINPATFTYEDMTLAFQGGPNIMNSSVVITQLDTAAFDVDLSTLTTGNGFYSFVVQAANVSDVYGINGLTGRQATWSQFLTVPTVQAFQGIPDSRMSASFDTVQVLFNLPIDEATVTPARFTITKNGVLQSGTLTIDSVRAAHKLFYLSGLKTIMTQTGEYLLTVDLPNIKTVNNVFGVQPQSVKLTLDNTGPVLLNLVKRDSGGIDPQHFPFVRMQFDEDVIGFNTSSVQLTRNGQVLPLAVTQLSNTDLKTWTAGNFGMLTYPEGAYTFTVNLDGIKDGAGNRGSGSQQIAWTINRSALIAITNLAVTPDEGFSNTDGITSGLSLNASFTLSAPAAQVSISQVDLSGETVLATVPSAAGNITMPVTLLTGGNTGIRVTATGLNGKEITAQKILFVDPAPLTAQWLFSSNQTITRQPDTMALSFSSKLLSDAGFLSAVQLRKNGVLLPTAGLSFQRLNDTLYNVYGLRQVSTVSGNYELAFDLQPFKKYSSGRAGSGLASVRWTVQKTNRAPFANAGPDIVVVTTGVVTLNGTASADPDGDSVTYRWIAPAGITLNDSTSATPAFTITPANRGLTYSFLLMVSDGSLFTTDAVTVKSVPSLCPGGDTYFTLFKQEEGTAYQWQVDSTGEGFVNLVTDAVHSRATADTLFLHAPPTAYRNYKYRCMVTKGSSVIYSPTYGLTFVTTWEGAVSTAWENPVNWSCNALPDENTDVIIRSDGPHVIKLSSNGACRSLVLSNGAVFTVAAGYNLTIKGK